RSSAAARSGVSRRSAGSAMSSNGSRTRGPALRTSGTSDSTLAATPSPPKATTASRCVPASSAPAPAATRSANTTAGASSTEYTASRSPAGRVSTSPRANSRSLESIVPTDATRTPSSAGDQIGGAGLPASASGPAAFRARRRADEHTREVAIERRVDAADALLERRVRGEQAGEPGPEPAREVEVAQLLRPWVLDARPRTQRADLLQRARNAVGIPGELYGR